MNLTVARLTVRGLLGRRRGLLLLAVPALLLVLSVVIRLAVGQDESTTVNVLGGLGLGTLVPLLGLIAGTGAIGPEIDDGSIVYLLAKPLPRWKIITTKLAVSVGCTALFGAIPMYIAGVILFGNFEHLALAYGVGALVAGVAYSSIFLLLGVVSRHAVVWGLLYSLVWESVFGGLVPGAKTLSVQQWSLAITRSIADPGVVTSAVHLPTAVPLLLVVILGGTAALIFAFCNLVQIAGAFLVPLAAGRTSSQGKLVVLMVGCYAVGIGGLIVAPVAGAWIWATLLGLGMGGGFGLAMALIVLRSGSPTVASQLSGMSQMVGYFIAACGPVGVGALHQATHGWTLPLSLLLVCCAVALVAGLGAGRRVTLRAVEAQ